MFELDHVYVMTTRDAPDAGRLAAAGWPIGRRRAHPGQGTANACVLFRTTMLELLFVEDEAAAAAELVRPLALPQRAAWRETGASPIGLALRRCAAPGLAPPAPCFAYAPPYLPPGPPIWIVGEPGDQRAPLVFTVPIAYSAGTAPPSTARHDITAVRVIAPGMDAEAPQRTLAVPGVTWIDGPQHLLEVTLDHADATSASFLDLRPDLPLILRWPGDATRLSWGP